MFIQFMINEKKQESGKLAEPHRGPQKAEASSDLSVSSS